jgi:hypothetical protein
MMTNDEKQETVVVLPSGGIGVVRPDLTVRQELAALKQFARKLQRMSPRGRKAAIHWLIDVYLRNSEAI